MRTSMYSILAVLLVPLATSPLTAQETPETGCAECHNETRHPDPPGPPHKLLAESSHAGLDCTDCHQTISMDDIDREAVKPHGAKTNNINCGDCHDDQAAVYTKYGRLDIDKDPDLPKCWSCHGTHDILPSSDRSSHVHLINLPSTCKVCHMNVDLVRKHFALREAPIRLFDSSVHGQGTIKGLYGSASCRDCHSATDAAGVRTAHRILSAVDPGSPIYHFNIPDTCGKCHKYVTEDYWDGIHGQYVKRGSTDAPVCTGCHGEHGIISPGDPRSPVSTARLAEQTCSPCHESAILNEKYGLPGGPQSSYIDSYHGLKSKSGDTTVANCASCHGSHRILPSSDPTSSINVNNLQRTCGECHPSITSELAQTKIHGIGVTASTGWPDFFRRLYIVLIVATIGGMLLHQGADWLRALRRRGREAFVQRLSPNETAQHWVFMISFIVLVLTGFSLRFSDAFWVRWMFGHDRGFELRGIIHRVAAVIMIICSVWHLLYLFTGRGRQWCRDMMASWMDVKHIRENLLYFIGLRRHGPSFQRFSYMEKVEYWALVWGTIIMSLTGLMLWFDNFLVEQWGVPKVLLDVGLVIHFYEAWLATLAILVWHIYGTVFKPDVYPMNPAWLTGRMPREMYLEEHPEGPRLKARTLTMRYEDEVEPPTTETHMPPTEREEPASHSAATP